MKLKHNTIERMEIDGVDCLVACMPILETPLVKEGTSKRTSKPYKIQHMIEPYWLPGAGFKGQGEKYTISFQATCFVNETQEF